MRSQATAWSVLTDTRAEELQQDRAASPETRREPTTVVEAVVRFPRLSKHVARLRGQKVCSYCKHTIEEDPYFQYESYWKRVLQNKSYLLRYVVLELAQWAAGVFYFIPGLKAWLLHVKEHLLLPGWVRCANPDCGQLYHASCWYQIAKTKGCLRCKTQSGQRVE